MRSRPLIATFPSGPQPETQRAPLDHVHRRSRISCRNRNPVRLVFPTAPRVAVLQRPPLVLGRVAPLAALVLLHARAQVQRRIQQGIAPGGAQGAAFLLREAEFLAGVFPPVLPYRPMTTLVATAIW